MIGKAFGMKVLPYVFGGAVFLLSAVSTVAYVLHTKNSALNERVGSLTKEKSQLAESLRHQSERYQTLAQELLKRDNALARAREARNQSERIAREQIEALRKALAQDECAGRAHPPAVADILRQGSGHSVQD